MKKILIGLLILNMNTVFAATNYSYQPTQVQPVFNSGYTQTPLQYPRNNTLRGNVIMVPAGVAMKAILTTPLSSEYTNVGQSVNLALDEDFYYDNRLVAQAGSTIYGTVIESSKAKRAGINGSLCVRFTQIFTPYGTQIPISGVIRTNDGTGVLQGGTKFDVTKEYAKDIAAGSITGALSGLVFGAIAGGEVGRGAALGTAVGAGSGLVKSVWDKGNDVVVPSGSIVDIMLLQPITVNNSSYYNEN